jgi:hypothetical protein
MFRRMRSRTCATIVGAGRANRALQGNEEYNQFSAETVIKLTVTRELFSRMPRCAGLAR